MKLAISKSDSKRIQIPLARDVELGPFDEVEVAIEVREPDYVPRNVQLRGWIDKNLLTGKILKGNLLELGKDERVHSVQVGKRLRIPKTDGR
ncbi:MAG TPA: hypothetical protein VGX37_13580 [Allosphingosinicella sp.]|jgi:hypothetical protein|nr:hypothetical protein [Allosphingosinicella sp.]